MLCFCYVACDVSITLAEQTSTIMEIIDEELEVDLSGHLDEEFLVNGN